MKEIINSEPDLLPSQVKTTTRRGLISITLIALIALVVSALIYRSIPLLAPYIRAQLGIDERQIGFVMAAQVVGSVLTTLPIGSVLGRVNTRTTFGTLMTAIGIGMFLVTFQNSIAGLIGILFVVGILKAGIFPLVNRIIAEHFASSQRGRITGFIFAAIPAGGLIGALTLPELAEIADWRAGYYLLGVMALLGAVVTWVLLPRDRGKSQPAQVKIGFKALKSRAFIVLCAAYGLFVLTESTEAFMTLYLVDVVKISAVLAGTFYGLIQLAAIGGRLFWGYLADRFFSGNRWWLLAFVNGLTILALLILVRLNSNSPDWLIALAMVTFGLGASSAGGILFTIIGDVVAMNAVAMATATVMFVSSISDMFGPMIYSLLLRLTSSYQGTIGFYIAIASVTGVTFISMAARNRQVERKPVEFLE